MGTANAPPMESSQQGYDPYLTASSAYVSYEQNLDGAASVDVYDYRPQSDTNNFY